MAKKEVFKNSKNDRVSDESQFVDSLRQIWLPHQQLDLKIRFEMGTLLNNKLGKPSVRQSYGMGTIKRVALELSIDKADISRMRWFADKYDSFEEFQKKEPGATCWTHIRDDLKANNKATDRPADSRASWGALRSLKSLIKAFESDHDFSGSKADEIRQSIRELVSLAKAKFDLDFN
jgi:hypothetical protein